MDDTQAHPAGIALGEWLDHVGACADCDDAECLVAAALWRAYEEAEGDE